MTLEKADTVGLSGLSQARLRSLDFDAKQGALHARFDGIARRASSRAGELVSDHRLTLFQTMRYSWRWVLIASAAAWLISTTLAGFEVFKKLRE